MEHFLIAITMALVGLFSVMSWESIFPERKDVLIMGPLPVKHSTLFLAKLTALITALGLVVFSLNCFTGVGWSIMFEPEHGGVFGLIRSIAAYWLTVSLAAAFVFCSVLTIQGLSSLLLPRQLFLRLSGVMQMAGFVLILGDFVLELSLESVSALTDGKNQHLLHCLPSYWFLALFQYLNGSVDKAVHATFAALSQRAWVGLTLAVAGSLISIVTAYFRVVPKIIEEPDVQPLRRNWMRNLPNVGSPIQRAVLAFSWRTLMRSRQHRLTMVFFLSVGLTVMLLYLNVPTVHQQTSSHNVALDATFLAASLIAMSLAVLGARTVASVPVMLKANWIFQLTQIHPANTYLTAGRKALFTIGVLPIWIVVAVLTLWMQHDWPVAVHLVALGLLGTMLIDLSVFTLRKLPFVCSWMPKQAHVVVIFFGGIIVGLPLAMCAGKYESELLQMKWGWVWLLTGLCAIALAFRCYLSRIENTQNVLIFDEENEPLLISLRLDH